MYSILSKKTPLFYEIMFDENLMSISFSLCSEANDYFINLLGMENRMTAYLKSQGDLSPFVFPKKEVWGFGGIFKAKNSKSIEKDWPTWECLLPRKARQNQLNDISASIQLIVDILQLFGYDREDYEIKDKLQFMTIDGMVTKSDKFMHGGEFNFSYARPVLEFCNKIWSDKKIYDEIVNTMQKTWMYLLGERKIKSYDKYSFRISSCQGDSRLISLTCPGNCA